MSIAYQQQNMPKVLRVFSFALLTALAGGIVGQFVPPVLMIPIAIAELVLIIAMMFLRKRKAIGYGMMYTFMALSGITTYSALSYYASTLGTATVFKAFLLAVVAFGVSAIYASSTKRDFSYLGSFLFAGLAVLVVTGLLSIFLPFNNTMDMIYSAVGVFIFIGYTLFDFNRLAHKGVKDEEIPFVVVSIYLDFVNLLLYILRLISSLSKN